MYRRKNKSKLYAGSVWHDRNYKHILTVWCVRKDKFVMVKRIPVILLFRKVEKNRETLFAVR